MTTSIDLSLAIRPKLKNRRVVIIGGTGGVGEGIVRSWLADGAEVIVPSRTEQRAAQLRGLLEDVSTDKLHFVVGDYTTFDGAEDIASRIESQHGAVTDVIASIGGWWQGKALWEVTQDEWQRFNLDLSTAHVANIRAWIPRLSTVGSYHLILGGSASQPVPGASIINMEQAGLLMMHQVLSAEVSSQRRVFAHELGPVATRQRQWVQPEWVSNSELGLLTSALAYDSTLASRHFKLSTKSQMLRELQAVGAYPEEKPA